MFIQYIMLAFTIHPSEKPWSTNQDRNLNPYQRAKLIKTWKEDTAGAWMTVPWDDRATYAHFIGRDETPDWFPPTIIQLEIGFTTSRKRDPHNYCGTVLKAVIDSLVNIGLWPDDTTEWVGHREPLLVKTLTTRVTMRHM